MASAVSFNINIIINLIHNYLSIKLLSQHHPLIPSFRTDHFSHLNKLKKYSIVSERGKSAFAKMGEGWEGRSQP